MLHVVQGTARPSLSDDDRRHRAEKFGGRVLCGCFLTRGLSRSHATKQSQDARIILQAHIAKMQTLLFLLSPMLATSFFESSLFYPRTTDLFYAETPNYYNLRPTPHAQTANQHARQHGPQEMIHTL